MKIGIDAHAVEREGSGNCTYMQNLLQQLASIDGKNEYVLFATRPDLPFYQQIRQHHNFRIRSVVPSPAWFRVFCSICLATYQEKIDLLHVQYFAPIGHRGRLVNTIHDVAFYRFPEYFSRKEQRMFKLLLPGSAARSRLVLTASNVSKRDLIELMRLSGEKIKVTPYGVDPAFVPGVEKNQIDRIRSLYRLPEKFLLYVGRIDARKNLSRLVEAYSHLRKGAGISHQLVFAGKTYLVPEQLKIQIEQSGFRNDIHFCGYVPQEDLPHLYQSADVFVYPSEYEGFGFPPLEAMACGIPVVASDLPIFQEILSDAAQLVDPRNPMEIAAAIRNILTDSVLRESLTKKGLMQAQQYNWKETARRTLQAYQEAVE